MNLDGTRCGIHGDPTHTGRCASCDAEPVIICSNPACERDHDTGTREWVPPDVITEDQERGM